MINWKDSVNYRKEKTTQGIRYMITIDGEDVEVTEEVYKVYSSMERNERYQEEQKKEKVISLEAIAEDDMRLELLEIEFVESAEETIIADEIEQEKELMFYRLHKAIATLDIDEQRLIRLIFFKKKTERDVAEYFHISQPAVHKRKLKVLQKLKNFIEN